MDPDPAADTGLPGSGIPVSGLPESPHEAGENWRTALMTLIASRIGIFRIESKQAAQLAARRSILIASASVCLLFSWALLICAGLLWLPEKTGLPVPGVALLLAIGHLIAGGILIIFAKRGSGPLFPATRSEFLKDRAWLENIQKHPNS